MDRTIGCRQCQPAGCFISSAEKGNVRAWSLAGYAYEDSGRCDKAIECYRKGAEAGDITAMHNLGTAYFIGGKYGEKNIRESVKWLETSANKGMTFSAAMLGYIYYHEFTRESMEKAVYWLKKRQNRATRMQCCFSLKKYIFPRTAALLIFIVRAEVFPVLKRRQTVEMKKHC